LSFVSLSVGFAQAPAAAKKAPAAAKSAAKGPVAAKAPAAPATPAPASAAAAPSEADFAGDEPPAPTGGVLLDVDSVTLHPGALASGKVTFSDGVTGKWIIDQQYRPGFTEISQPGYRPSPADAQAFMQELGRAMQARGF
jgi:hypothetical protein